jgi:hypothetical protein
MSDHAKREPFCWLEKRKLRIIADVFAEGRLGALTSARSVYLALSEIASDRQNDTFTVATSYIAQRAGVTSKTVRRVIKILKWLVFVKIQGRSASGLKLAYEYTLIRGDRPIEFTREQASDSIGAQRSSIGKRVLEPKEHQGAIR